MGGNNRQVLDRSYYMGILRSKIGELSAEITTLTLSIGKNSEEKQNLAAYERKSVDLMGVKILYTLLVKNGTVAL